MSTAGKNPKTEVPTGENETFGPYEVFERLGVGGMATVHRAKERGIEGFERVVALKRLLPHLAEDASFVRSFVREAKLASLLRHANIVQLYELGRVGAVYFISMELIEGRDVRRLLRQARRVTGPPPLSVFLSLLTQLCDALHYAHTRSDDKGQPLGIVHRDVSPSNLIITESGHLKIIDFGIAKAQTEQLRTQTGRIKGKLAYMAPEAIRGHELDARSDVWAAGVIAHELLTARPLFASKNEYQTLMRVQSADIEPPSKFNENCPSELDDVVLMALAREPAERWQTAAEFRDGLEYVRSQYQVSATSSDVAEWITWAFSQGQAASTSSFDASGSSSHTVSADQVSAPARAFARARSRSAAQTGGMAAVSEVEAKAALEKAAQDDALTAPRGSEPVVPPPSALDDDRPPDDRPPISEDEEEEAATFAWGSHEQDDAKPVVLDDVPEVSDRASVADMRPPSAPAPKNTPAVEPARAPSSAGFGAGIVAQGESNKRTGLIIGVSIVAAIAGVLAFFLIIRSSNKEAASVEEKPSTGILKFKVEPADATISVLGYGSHTGLPYQLEVEAPGIYSIEISRDGYMSRVMELQVEAGEKQTLAMALQVKSGSDKAQVKLDSTPSNKRIFIDGEDTGRRTPSLLEMTPGKHVLSLQEDDGTEVWSHEFDVDVDKQYEFLPSIINLEKRAQLEKERDERASRSDDRSRRSDRSSRRKSSDRPRTAANAAVTEVVEAGGSSGDSSSDAIAAQTGGTPSGLSSLGKLPGMSTLPVKPPPSPSPSPSGDKGSDSDDGERSPTSGPVTISANEAKKISGRAPSLSGLDPTIKAVSAKLCIDTRGRVDSVSVVSDLRSRPKTEVMYSLKKWRYKPVVRGGQKVPACFVVSFRIAHR